MNNIKKRITTFASALAVLSVATAYANTNVQGKIFLNNTPIDNAVVTEGEMTYLPLRAVCEGLGMTVEWIDESRTIQIVDLPTFITCSPDYDGYTFARTAPMLLGASPKLINDVTYVPSNFIEEILHGTLDTTDGNYNIFYGEQAVETSFINGTICQMVYEDDKLVQIVIGEAEDEETQTVLNLTDEMREVATNLGLDVGVTINAEVEALATLSIPPQMIPVSIEIAVEETDTIQGTVCELIFEDEKLVKIAIGDKEDVYSQTILNLSETLAKKVQELEIKEGTQITATTKNLETMSIPPQRIPLDIEISK